MFAYQGEDGWAALGDPTRRAIVASLAEGPRAVGELAAELPVSRPAVSWSNHFESGTRIGLAVFANETVYVRTDHPGLIAELAALRLEVAALRAEVAAWSSRSMP